MPSNDLRISEFTDSLPGAAPTTCEESTRGTSPSAVGTFISALAPFLPKGESAYKVIVEIRDSQGVHVGY